MISEWLIYALGAIPFGVGYFLLFRRMAIGSDLGKRVPVPIWAMLTCGMAATGIIAAIMVIESGLPSELPVPNVKAIGVLAAAVVCCYAGNMFELKAIAGAPNAGYALSINKSYAAFTLFAAWWLFGSELDGIKIAGALMIVFFQIVARAPWQSKKAGRNKSIWIWHAIISFFGLAGLALSCKYLMLAGMGRAEFLAILAAPVTILFAINWLRCEEPTPRTRETVVLLAGIGLMSALLNYCLYSAIALAMNPGYATAISAAQIGPVTFLSAKLSGDELSFWQIAAIAGITLGLLLIAY